MTVEVVVQQRYRCPWCRRTYARRPYAAKHADQCSQNPALHGCSTCVHFVRTPCCAELSDHCGCKGLNDCAVGAFESWRFNDHETHAPHPEGWWRHVEDYKRDGCDVWESRP